MSTNKKIHFLQKPHSFCINNLKTNFSQNTEERTPAHQFRLAQTVPSAFELVSTVASKLQQNFLLHRPGVVLFVQEFFLFIIIIWIARKAPGFGQQHPPTANCESFHFTPLTNNPSPPPTTSGRKVASTGQKSSFPKQPLEYSCLTT